MQNTKTLTTGKKAKTSSRSGGWGYYRRHLHTYLFLVPGIVLVFIFNYIPLSGLRMAFLDYDVFKAMDSPFVGFQNFRTIFETPAFMSAVWNTLKLSLLSICVAFPLPIVFALMLNELKNGLFKRFTQTVSYLPHFISTIAVVGLATTILSEYGIVNDIRLMLFGEEAGRVLYLTIQKLFVPLNIGLGIWQSLGWSTIIYLAAISGVDSELYDAAIIDGAGKFRQCLHVTLPSLINTVIILLILRIGKLFASSFDLIYGLQNVFIDFEVISTIVYKQGITSGNYGVATALSLAQGLISVVLVMTTNYFSKKYSEVSVV